MRTYLGDIRPMPPTREQTDRHLVRIIAGASALHPPRFWRALSELDLLREPLSTAAHKAGRTCAWTRILRFSCSEVKPASDARQPASEGVENDWKDGKADEAFDWSHTSCWPCCDPTFMSSSWFNAPPMGSRPDYWRNEWLYRADDFARHPGPKRALPSRGRGVLIRTYHSARNKYERFRVFWN